MSTIVTINASDQITNSRIDLNTNFSNLNSDKIETSVLDTDTALTANSDSKIATQKAIKAYVDANIVVSISSETTTANTHSLITVADQKVIVWAKGDLTYGGTGGAVTITLKYDGVTKDTVKVYVTAAPTFSAFALQYTETPGAATKNITVETSSDTLENVKIIVLKFNV